MPGSESGCTQSTLPFRASTEIRQPPFHIATQLWLQNHHHVYSSVEASGFCPEIHSCAGLRTPRSSTISNSKRFFVSRPRGWNGIMGSMKAKPKTSDEYATFENALRTVLQVPHSEIQRRLKAAKQERQRRRKRASGHASDAKD